MSRAEAVGRWVAGLLLFALGFFIQWPGYWDYLFLVLGLVVAVTAAMRYCPLKQAVLRSFRA